MIEGVPEEPINPLVEIPLEEIRISAPFSIRLSCGKIIFVIPQENGGHAVVDTERTPITSINTNGWPIATDGNIMGLRSINPTDLLDPLWSVLVQCQIITQSEYTKYYTIYDDRTKIYQRRCDCPKLCNEGCPCREKIWAEDIPGFCS